MRSLRLVLLAVTLLGFGAHRAAGQTTYDACYVPSVGAIYLIKQAGLPTACLAQNHVAFSWISGGTGGTSDHGGLTGLTDDDHPQYLLGNAARAATDGFAVTGTLNTGALAATGAGVRLLWYPRKAAFRAGEALSGGPGGPAWDDADIGLWSVGLGVNTLASGTGSLAVGSLTAATGYGSTALGSSSSASGTGATAMGSSAANADYTTAMGQSSAHARAATAMGNRSRAIGLASTAMGDSSVADRDYSTAIGRRTFAGGISSTALGDSTTASGERSTAMGYRTVASGGFSTAFGVNTVAGGNVSTALGSNTEATGPWSTALGFQTHATGWGSTATGSNTTASGNYSTALGELTTAQAFESLVIGQLNVVTGIPDGWIPTDPLFVAGNGGGQQARSNALTLLKNGNLTIAGTLTQSSDLRFKEQVEPLGNTLAGVLRLQPIRYQFREGTGHPTDRQIGLGAQDVERIFPELVHRDSQGHLSVAYTQLSAVLVRAVQEQQLMIETLRAEVAALRATRQR